MNQPEPKKGRFGNFWKSLPGIFTATAALLGAIAAILALFIVPGDGDGGPTRAEWADKVDPICGEATDAIRQLPNTEDTEDLGIVENVLFEWGGIVRRMAEKVRAVEAPIEDQQTIDRMTGLWLEGADAVDSLVLALRHGDEAEIQSILRQIEASDKASEVDELARSLGVTSCTQTPRPLRTGSEQNTSALAAPAESSPSTSSSPPAPPAESSPSTSSSGSLNACDQNISANEVTSCSFAANVFVAYWEEYETYGEQAYTHVTAFSPTTNKNHGMECALEGGTVNCSGANGAFVTFPIQAVRVY
jgi:hypothetical protein